MEDETNNWNTQEPWGEDRQIYQTGHSQALFVRRKEQERARIAEVGIWAGEFDYPWDWRASEIQTANSPSPNQECIIKGNISGNGRIYLMPFHEHYNRTNINESSCERWFFSEDEALAAGWRRALR